MAGHGKVFLGLLALLGAFAGSSWGAVTTGTVAGSAADSGTSARLAGVAVKAVQSGAVKKETTTDAAGNFSQGGLAVVPVLPEDLSITALATNQDGLEASDRIIVGGVGQGLGDSVALTASPAGGAAPLAATFHVETSAALAPTSFEWDLDGDGVFEASSPAAADQVRIYPAPGVFNVKVRVNDDAGVSYTAVRAVRVTAPPTLARELSAAAPNGVATDADRNLYVAQGTLGRVSVFAPDGTPLRTVGTPGAGPGQLGNAVGAGVDANGRVFVLDAANRKVQQYDAAGAPLLDYGSDVLADPRGIAVDNFGTAYVTDAAGRVHSFDSDGGFIATLGEADAAWSGFSSPSGVTLGPRSTLYVADSGNHRIVQLAPNGRFLRSFGAHGSGAGQYNTPTDVAWDEVMQTLAVADKGNARLVLTDAEGRAFTPVALAGAGIPAATVAVGTDDRRQLYYATDKVAGRVVAFEVPFYSPAPVWAQMRERLGAGDVEGALAFFTVAARDRYRRLFHDLQAQLPAIAAGMAEIELSYRGRDSAKYSLVKPGTANSYPVYFVLDESGAWKVSSF